MKTLQDIEIRAVIKTEDVPEIKIKNMAVLYIQYRKKFSSEWTEWENAERIGELSQFNV